MLNEGQAAGDIVAAIRNSSELVRDVDVFDVFTGKGVPPGRKSLGVRIRYQAKDRTLTDKEVNAAREEAVKTLAAEFGADAGT